MPTRIAPSAIFLATLCMALSLAGTSPRLAAQEVLSSEPVYRVEAFLGGGYGFRLNPPIVPPGVSYNHGGFAGFVRVMWRPEHLLSVGLATGYIRVSDVESAVANGPAPTSNGNGNVRLSATPFFLVFTMQKYGVDLGAGIGLYSLTVTGNQASGSVVGSTGNEIGYTFMAGYTLPITQQIAIGAEVQLLEFTDRPIGILVPQLRLRWTALTY